MFSWRSNTSFMLFVVEIALHENFTNCKVEMAPVSKNDSYNSYELSLKARLIKISQALSSLME